MITKNKKILNWVITGTLVAAGMYCYLKSYGYCEEYRIPHTQEYLFENIELRSHGHRRPTGQQRIQWQEEYELHLFHAKRTYEDAKNRVWYLPNVTWRQRGREAWNAAFATVGATTPQLKLVLAVSSLLCQYGLDCMDEWEYIEEKLYWSEYHFKECEKYQELLNG
jgi:hypothetical protein